MNILIKSIDVRKRHRSAARHPFAQCACTFICALLFVFTPYALPIAKAVSSEVYRDSPNIALSASRWRFVHVLSPVTGRSSPALLQVADLNHSDPGFIGTMIRCDATHDPAALMMIFVVAQPFPPRVRPKVTLRNGMHAIIFTADVIPPGASISIPLNVKAQIHSAWRDATDVSVQINYRDMTLHGLIGLAGLSGELPDLAMACAEAKPQ